MCAGTLGNVEFVYAGLDVLGSMPWKVNRKIFDVVLKVWNSGEFFIDVLNRVADGGQKLMIHASSSIHSNFLWDPASSLILSIFPFTLTRPALACITL